MQLKRDASLKLLYLFEEGEKKNRIFFYKTSFLTKNYHYNEGHILIWLKFEKDYLFLWEFNLFFIKKYLKIFFKISLLYGCSKSWMHAAMYIAAVSIKVNSASSWSWHFIIKNSMVFMISKIKLVYIIIWRLVNLCNIYRMSSVVVRVVKIAIFLKKIYFKMLIIKFLMKGKFWYSFFLFNFTLFEFF